MGYCTNYSLETDATPDSEVAENIAARLRDDEGEGDFVYALEEKIAGVEYGPRDACKWYEHQKDLVELSKQFPGVLFTLSGEGEENGDLWKLYVRNGVAQEAKAVITYPPCTLA